jgi:hypothetical protein
MSAFSRWRSKRILWSHPDGRVAIGIVSGGPEARGHYALGQSDREAAVG